MVYLKRATNAELLKVMGEAGISRAELARRLEVSRASVAYMLRPTQNLQLDTLEELARVMGYQVKVSLKKR